MTITPDAVSKTERDALAAWLRGEAATAEGMAQAAADEYGAKITREAASKLARAAAIVEGVPP